ncbi:uncharacterized protein PADG_11561 [Paracoccidioides brasiliensis Pb18]|uniref:Uncharacterized protein n=1 Tax=Paracoccidioides brasiliensis (strain Pb18) TaxID=502780 RepID=A0A0A0HUS8_PARBD|nr:uncharacterized protein PADG_11561 [Paracoccidioides brasiliensis Pb18]KGM92362.1 hypothetical protein PADG_11561 [Paracoccidioides brasiliensis Pb18]ODH46320.1 hypothetical protein GX48_07590 [Paracoccidioides brasiliensis]
MATDPRGKTDSALEVKLPNSGPEKFCFSKGKKGLRLKSSGEFSWDKRQTGLGVADGTICPRFQIAGDMGDTKAEAGGGKGEAMTVGVLVINNAVRRTVLEV